MGKEDELTVTIPLRDFKEMERDVERARKIVPQVRLVYDAIVEIDYILARPRMLYDEKQKQMSTHIDKAVTQLGVINNQVKALQQTIDFYEKSSLWKLILHRIRQHKK